MLRIMIIAIFVAGPAWAGCPPKDYVSVPKVIGLPYPTARANLIEAGFQPLLDWSRMQKEYNLAGETWIAETNSFEVQACPNTGTRACIANFVDKHRNLLRIVTEDPSGNEPDVADAFFVCGIEAANVFLPREDQ